MIKALVVLFLFLGISLVYSNESSSQPIQHTQKAYSADSSTVYETENLVIKRLSEHVYVHVSYLNTDDFGKVACNGMLVINEKEGVVFDTPTDTIASLSLLNFVVEELKSKIVAVVPTHFHNDCLGGITTFEKHNVPTYAHRLTIELLKKSGVVLSKPVTEFRNKLSLKVGDKKVYVEYFGEGHTKDNVVAYFPSENTLFGGCLIKEVGASKGYLGDANTSAWAETVNKIKRNYPNIQTVIPGHGKVGNSRLLDYTTELFSIK